jgi:hypothetical protein
MCSVCVKLDSVQKLGPEVSWIWKKCDKTGIEGFKIWKNPPQTPTQRTFTLNFKMSQSNEMKCYLEKEE